MGRTPKVSGPFYEAGAKQHPTKFNPLTKRKSLTKPNEPPPVNDTTRDQNARTRKIRKSLLGLPNRNVVYPAREERRILQGSQSHLAQS
jgi:hypothetical protein